MAGSLRLLLLLVAVLTAQALVGRCAHDEKQEADVPERKLARSVPTSYMNAYARAGGWEPIRISVYYGNLQLTKTMEGRLKGAIRGMKNWLQNSLKVRRVTKSWDLQYVNCGDTYYTGSINTDYFNSDFILYVISDMKKEGVAGYATYCQRDSDTGQPVVGLYYFSGGEHETADDEAIFSTTVHEITHAFGFSNNLYDQYRKPNGMLYTNAELYSTETARGHSVRKIITPNVAKRARDTFGCPSLNGLELESDGGSGTAGSHWEKRIVYNEFMVADSNIYDVIYSDLTLALLEDSGWYQPNYKYSTPVLFGSKKGCPVLTEKCVKKSVAISSDFCTDEYETGCDFLGLRKGYCDLGTASGAYPPEYQYFGYSNYGGFDSYLDYCPVIKPYSNGNCRDPSSLLTQPGRYEVGGLTSRCLPVNFVSGRSSTKSMGCYKTECKSGTLYVTIGSNSITCPKAGGQISVQGFGSVQCPAYDKFCVDVPCINNCYGFGYCSKGVCVCDDGTTKCNSQYN